MTHDDKRDFRISLMAGLYAVVLFVALEFALNLIRIFRPFDEMLTKPILIFLIGLIMYWEGKKHNKTKQKK